MPDQTLQYPALSPDLEGGFNFKMLKYFGAGAIMASVTIGSGETFFASTGGAIFGYAMLWCFVGGAIMKGVQVYAAARYMTLTGEHPMAHWKFLPGPRGWAPASLGVISILCFPFWLAGLPLFIGKTMNWIFGIDDMLMQSADIQALGEAERNAAVNDKLLMYGRVWGTLCVAIAVTLTWLQSYGILEKAQTFIVSFLLASMLAACFAANPDWLEALAGLIPSVPTYDPWIAEKYPELVFNTERIREILVENNATLNQIPLEQWPADAQALVSGNIEQIKAVPMDSAYREILKAAQEKNPAMEWAAIGLYLGAIGGGTYDYIGYVGCFREKKWGLIGTQSNGDDQHETQAIAQSAETLPIDTSDENIKRGRHWLWPAKVDVGIGFLCVLIFTVCFVLLGAAILRPDHAVPSGNELLTHQAKFLTQFGGSFWLFLYQVGIFMAFFGTIYGAYEIYIRTSYECLMPLSKRLRAMSNKRFRAWILAYCAIGGTALLWTMDEPAKIVAPAAIIGGVFTCGLWCLGMLWADRRFLPKPLRMGPVLTILLWISGIVLTGLGVMSIYEKWISPLLG